MIPVAPQIRIHGLQMFARVGVTQLERAEPQRLVANIVVFPRRDFSELDDDIDCAVNYAAIVEETQQLVHDRSDALIETLAHAIAQRLIEQFAISRAVVEVRKFVVPDTDYVSVTTVREAQSN